MSHLLEKFSAARLQRLAASPWARKAAIGAGVIGTIGGANAIGAAGGLPALLSEPEPGPGPLRKERFSNKQVEAHYDSIPGFRGMQRELKATMPRLEYSYDEFSNPEHVSTRYHRDMTDDPRWTRMSPNLGALPNHYQRSFDPGMEYSDDKLRKDRATIRMASRVPAYTADSEPARNATNYISRFYRTPESQQRLHGRN